MERKNAWKNYTEADLVQVEDIAVRYRAFLDEGKTERECVSGAVKLAEAKGYCDLAAVIKEGKPLQAGDKVYVNVMGKAICLFHLGSQPLEKGMNIVGAHVDSPRIDLKQNPLYEDSDFAYMDTHYYGGIKKFQWMAQPLALHGVVAKKDGTVVNIVIGDDPADPVIGISDLLIHLSGELMGRKAGEYVNGEQLDIIVGGKPVQGEEKDAVKTGVLNILKEKYDIEEEDFLSAEIEVVPAGKARDFGLDRSMILGYGHDDRVCAFAALDALLSIEGTPEKTCCCLFSDKEEIGSVGATGMQASYFENAVAELINLTAPAYSDLILRRALANCSMLSTDVSAGYDPSFAGKFERKNTAFLGRGVAFNKYTGSRGKGGSNDANAEFVAKVRKLMDDAGVYFQTAELGAVDVGGGGTIAYICALYGMNVIDSGVPVLNMHAPYEIINKADLLEAKRGYLAFMLNA
ncbi:MAG: aminopeptidase [Eubacteriales bacterium]|nr:aminopeptidase [Eubacteriales bacterium]